MLELLFQVHTLMWDIENIKNKQNEWNNNKTAGKINLNKKQADIPMWLFEIN